MKAYLMVPAILWVMIFFGCAKTEGSVKIINKSDNKVFFSFDEGVVYTLDGSESNDPSREFNFRIGDQFLFFKDNTKKMTLYIEGETFQIEDYADTSSVCVNTTEIEIEDGKTKKIYVNPNRACVKVVNNSTEAVTEFGIKYYNGSNTITLVNVLTTTVESGEEYFRQLNFHSVDQTAFYGFKVTMSNGNVIDHNYEEVDIAIALDEVYLIDIE